MSDAGTGSIDVGVSSEAAFATKTGNLAIQTGTSIFKFPVPASDTPEQSVDKKTVITLVVAGVAVAILIKFFGIR